MRFGPPVSALFVRPAGLLTRSAPGLLAFGFLVLAVSDAGAQTLVQAVDAAWSRHPQARMIELRRTELEARLEAAKGVFAGPGSLGIEARSDRFNRDLGEREYQVQIGAPVWLPGQREASISLAQHEIRRLDAQGTALRSTLAAEIRAAWVTIELARADTALAGDLADNLGKLEDDVRRRLKAGEASRFDANLVHGERLAADAATIEAQTRATETEFALRALTGLDRHGGYPAEPDSPADPPEHPQLAAARSASSVAMARLRGAQASTRDNPEVSVFVRQERSSFDAPYDKSVGVKLRIPFSSAPRVQAGIAAAQAEAERDEAELRNAELRTSLDVEKARRVQDAARRQLELAQSRRQLAADNLALARKSYDLGESDLATLLRVQSSAFEAQRAAERARIGVLVARGRLNHALGALP